MAVRHGYGKIAGTDALVFAYDTGDTRNSYKGEPTTNYVPDPYAYNLYAYASGPVDTSVFNENGKTTTAKRYTVTQAVNTARAAIYHTNLTTGVAYTFSFKWKYNGSTTASPTFGVSAYKGYPEGGANNNGFTSATQNTQTLTNGWYLTTYTFVLSSCPTGGSILTFGLETGGTAGFVGETFDIYEAQFEIKDHRTQYSNGTRSATQGLLDLTGNNTIDLSNVSFDSNAQKFFDGSNDYIQLTSTIRNNFTSAPNCVELVLKKSSTVQRDMVVFDVDITRWNLNYNMYVANQWSFDFYDGTEHVIAAGNYDDSYVHFTLQQLDNGTMEIYANGELKGTEAAGNLAPNTSNPRIGSRSNGDSRYFEGELPLLKIYNRALTADEVRNNYRHYKNRFNIS